MKRLVVARVDPMDGWSGTRCEVRDADGGECGSLGWWTFTVEERDVDVDEAPADSAQVCHGHVDGTFDLLRRRWLGG